MEKLADSFTPGPFDVICARGKEAYTHAGNRSFRATLEFHLDSYANARSKQDKTDIVSLIFNAIQEATPDGGFIRKNEKGEWCRVPNHVAREKVGQGFRDLLHTEYRSSTKAKIERRRARMHSDIQKSPPPEAKPVRHFESSAAASRDDATSAAMPPLLGERLVSKSFSYDNEPLPLAQGGTGHIDILRQCSFSFIRGDDDGSQKERAADTEATVAVTPETSRAPRRIKDVGPPSDHRPASVARVDSHNSTSPVSTRSISAPHYLPGDRHFDRRSEPVDRRYSYPGQRFRHTHPPPPPPPQQHFRADYFRDAHHDGRAPAWQDRTDREPTWGGRAAFNRYNTGNEDRFRDTRYYYPPPNRRYR